MSRVVQEHIVGQAILDEMARPRPTFSAKVWAHWLIYAQDTFPESLGAVITEKMAGSITHHEAIDALEQIVLDLERKIKT